MKTQLASSEEKDVKFCQSFTGIFQCILFDTRGLHCMLSLFLFLISAIYNKTDNKVIWYGDTPYQPIRIYTVCLLACKRSMTSVFPPLLYNAYRSQRKLKACLLHYRISYSWRKTYSILYEGRYWQIEITFTNNTYLHSCTKHYRGRELQQLIITGFQKCFLFVCVYTCINTCMWQSMCYDFCLGSGVHLWEIFSTSTICILYWSRVVGLGNKCLYPQSQFPGPNHCSFLNLISLSQPLQF